MPSGDEDRDEPAQASTVFDVGGLQSAEAELRRRNREIAQVRDKLRQRERQVEDLQVKNCEINARLADSDGELARLRCRVRTLERERPGRQVTEELNCKENNQNSVNVNLNLVKSDSKEALRVRELESHVAELEAKLEREAAFRQTESQRAASFDEEVERRLSQALVTLEESLSGERRARRDAEARCAEARRCSEDSSRRLERLTKELEAFKESSLAQSLQAFEVERQLRSELAEAIDHASALKKEQSRRPAVGAKIEARVRILHTENTVLRAEAGEHRQRQRELIEVAAMLDEEMRTRRAQAAADIAQMQQQLAASRRARALELQALVTHMCQPSTRLVSKLAVMPKTV